MARIQILQLPPYGRDGDAPFALIVDKALPPPDDQVAEERSVAWQGFGQQIGARSVLVTDEDVDIAGEESDGAVSIEFDHAALLDTVSAAVRAHLESPTEHHFHFAQPTMDAKRLGKLAEERARRQRGDR